MSKLTNYIAHVALATDDEINAIFGGYNAPSPQGTISLRAAVAKAYGKGHKKQIGRAMCAFLSWGCRFGTLVTQHYWKRTGCDHCGQVLQEAIDQGQRL